jgi:hypothetical protein
MEVDDGGIPRTVDPHGRLLTTSEADGRLWLFEEELPREGTLVDRIHRYALARWTLRAMDRAPTSDRPG